MTIEQKQQIEIQFKAKAERLGLSMEKAAINAGTKGSTISQVFSGKYGANDEGIYKLLSLWVGNNDNWNIAHTRNFKLITGLLEDAHMNSNSYLIIGSEGRGKTGTFKYYADNYRNAILLRCDEFWNRKKFLAELLTRLGKTSGGMSLADMIDSAISHIISLESTIIIMDEADKLSDQVLCMFISLYNRLEDSDVGLVMAGTQYLENRIRKGVNNQKRGYREVWSRLGRKSVELVETGHKDVEAICRANGIDDADTIASIFKNCEGDLRRVKKLVHKFKLMQTV
jgi:DNA transposition AAA+ family ATPase